MVGGAHEGESDDNDKDCFQKLSAETQLAIGKAFETQPMADAANLMREHQMCKHCVAYYSYVSMTIMLANGGTALDLLAISAGNAVGAVLGERWLDGNRG